MFAAAFFAPRYFAPRYWPEIGSTVTPFRVITLTGTYIPARTLTGN